MSLDGEVVRASSGPRRSCPCTSGCSDRADTGTRAGRAHPRAVLHRGRLRARRAPGDPLPAAAARRGGPGGAVRHVRHARARAAVRAALEDRQAALMANHGSVAVGAPRQGGRERLLLEWLAALHHRAQRAGRRRACSPRASRRTSSRPRSRATTGPPQINRRTHEDRHRRRARPRHPRDRHRVDPGGVGRPAGRDDPDVARRHSRRHGGGAEPAGGRGGVVRRGRRRPDRRRPAGPAGAEGVDTSRAGAQGRPPDLGVGDPGPAQRRPAGLALHRRQRRVHPRRPRPRSTASTTCTSAGRSSSAARRPASCSPTRAGAGATTSLDILAPGDPDMLAWIADALPHTDYLLPNDEQVLGFTGAARSRTAPARCSTRASAAWR